MENQPAPQFFSLYVPFLISCLSPLKHNLSSLSSALAKGPHAGYSLNRGCVCWILLCGDLPPFTTPHLSLRLPMSCNKFMTFILHFYIITQSPLPPNQFSTFLKFSSSSCLTAGFPSLLCLSLHLSWAPPFFLSCHE